MATHPNLTDAALRHQVYLERLKTGQIREFLLVFKESDAAIRLALQAAGVDLLTDMSPVELERLVKDLSLKQGELFSAVIDKWMAQLPDLAEYEAQHEVRALRSEANAATRQQLKIPSAKKVATESLRRPVQAFGKRVEDVAADWSKSAIDRTNGAIRVGYAQGKTVPQVISQLLGTKALKYKDGSQEISKRTAATVVRTGIQEVANTARQVVYEENDDLVVGYIWVSTLDQRTSTICRSLDGQRFKLGQGPVPPIHPNCRSTTTPDVSSEFDFLNAGATRSSADGYVNQELTYYDWLKRQTGEFQDGVLGPTRGQLFRDGGLSSDRFRELQLDKNFEPLTLDEMRELEPKAFNKAGL